MWAGATALAAGFLTLVSSPAAADVVPNVFVNGATGHDTGNCTSSAAPCATISYALTQANPGATIKIFPGTYKEQVTISKSVTLLGTGPGQTTIDPTSLPLSDTDPDSATPQDYIVGVAPGTTGVRFKNLAVDGSGASPTFTSCSNDLVGVYFHDASGSINNVRAVNMVLPAAQASCREGLAFYVATDTGQTSKVTMSHVRARRYQRNGITCDDPGTTCTITYSTLSGAGPTPSVTQNGIQIFGASATIIHDRVSLNSYTGGGAGNQATGILVLNAGSATISRNVVFSNDIDVYAAEIPSLGLLPPSTGTWTINNNMISLATDAVPGGAPGNGYGDGISVDSTSGTVNVIGNHTGGNAEYGIVLRGTTGVVVHANTARTSHDGIHVGGPGAAQTTSTRNIVTQNLSTSNVHDGISAEGVTVDSGNTFSSNRLSSNRTAQAADQSTGTGTAGTANTWTDNTCRGIVKGSAKSSPVGLC